MNFIGGLVVFFYSLFAIFVIVAVIYLIVKRIEEKDKETFEKRKN